MTDNPDTVTRGTASVTVCEACGHPLRITVPIQDIGIMMSGKRRQLFDLLASAGSAGMTQADLFERIYGHDPDGGPASSNVISVMIAKLNQRLAPIGMRIRTQRDHHVRGFYRLVKP